MMGKSVLIMARVLIIRLKILTKGSKPLVLVTLLSNTLKITFEILTPSTGINILFRLIYFTNLSYGNLP